MLPVFKLLKEKERGIWQAGPQIIKPRKFNFVSIFGDKLLFTVGHKGLVIVDNQHFFAQG